MTKDFLDDFTDALVKEKRGFFVLVHDGKGPHSGAHGRFDLTNWPPSLTGKTLEHDMLEAVAAVLSSPGRKYKIVVEEE